MRWKIADFGLTTEATSKRAHTTQYSRGTRCYRAPELLKENPTYSNKVDIFGMGCIFHEMATGRKAFPDDFSIHQYSISQFAFSFPEDPLVDSESHTRMSALISPMLAKDGPDRPAARDLRILFAFHLSWSVADECKSRQEFPAAIKAYEFATSRGVREFSYGTLLRNLGDCYKAIHLYEKAKFHYESAIEAGLTVASLYSDLGDMCVLSHDSRSAAIHYTRARTQAPENTELLSKLVSTHANIAAAEVKACRYNNALSSYKTALEIAPSDVHLWECCGDAYMLTKDYDGAIKTFKNATKEFPEQTALLQKLGEAYIVTGNPKAAVQVYRTASKKKPVSELLLLSLLEAEYLQEARRKSLTFIGRFRYVSKSVKCADSV
jgi:tetratricopeptide (TPR) repeat protein